jgi:prepilin-type N-terminal cleavage/methylation domain-containing protein
MPHARPHRRSHAFTLLELLTVVAILALLAAISFGVIRSTKQRANAARAKAELALLVQALEDYKRHYGDYPQTGPSVLNSQRVTGTIGPATAQSVLFNSLLGVYGPTGARGGRLNGPRFVDIQKFKLEVEPTVAQLASLGVPIGSPPAKTPFNSAFLDPWGNRYLYFYRAAPTPPRPPAPWSAPSFILYSTGPSGGDVSKSKPIPNALGLFPGTTQTAGNNADNIYADKLP